jgi:UDP-N-acetylmuramate dehydrogenase
MLRRSHVPFAELTSLQVGGPAATVAEPVTTDELCDAVGACDDEGTPLLVIGSGTNLVVSDDGFDGVVVRVATRGRSVERDGDEMVASVAAGEPLDELVAATVAAGWSGLEALSGVPGTVGATPVQNVGADGQEISAVVRGVQVLDRASGEVRELAAVDCRFGYRTSLLKANPRFVVLTVTLALTRGPARPVRYAELARALGVPLGARPPLADVRSAVLELRAAKGMLAPGVELGAPGGVGADEAAPASAGSFFTNPLLPAEVADALPAQAPRWPAADGRVKVSAAWLIEHAGFTRGYGSGPARLSPRHALAIVNTGGARTADVLALARQIRAGVHETFGVVLSPEPTLVGCVL